MCAIAEKKKEDKGIGVYCLSWNALAVSAAAVPPGLCEV